MRDKKNIEWLEAPSEDWKTLRNKIIFKNSVIKNHGKDTVLSLYRELGVIPKDSRDDNHNVTSLDTDSYKYVENGDLVINKMKAWSGSLAISNYNGIVSPAYYVCKPNYNYVNKRFIHHYLRNIGIVQAYEKYSAGMRIGQWDLSIDDFLSLYISIPNLEEQQKIATYLDTHCSKVDTLIANQQSQIEKLKSYKQSLITEVVTKGLDKSVTMKDSGVEWIGEIASTFSVQNIRSLFQIRKDIIGHEPETVLSITQNGIKIKDISENSGQMANSYANYQIVHIGDFAMNHMDLLTGGIGISEYEGVTSPDYRVFELRHAEMNPRYFLYIFESYYRNKIFYAFGQGAANLGRWRLPAKNFYSTYIPVAPIKEQNEIVEYLDKKLSQIDSLISLKQQKIEKLQQYKKSLIYEYVTGKKEVE